MRINTNVSALNAANNLGRVQAEASESMAKLSSGFRINKAADDAAGLGIANKLRADTRALSQASRNAEQTNSLLQVAEGSTSTIQKMLERMKELATQSGSDTVDDAGRGRINAEFTALRSEISRTVNTTKFQGNALLDGTFGNVAGALSASDVTFQPSGDAAIGAYSLAVSDAGVATLTRPSGGPQTVNLTTLTSADYSGGKVSLQFGTGTSKITIQAIADSANDIASVKAALNGKGFSVQAGAAAVHSGTQLAPQAGVTIGTIGGGVSDGTYTFAATDRVVTQGGSQAGVTVGAVGLAQAAGIYSIAVTDSSIASNVTAGKITGLTSTTAQDAGTYVMKVSGSGTSTKVDLYASTDTGFASSLGSTTIGTYTNAADMPVTLGGISFTIDKTTNADLAAVSANLEGKTITVTAAKIDVKDSVSAVVATQNLTTGYAAGDNITFSNASFAFTLSGANANTDTYAEVKAALQATTITLADAKIDVKNGSGTTVATQSYNGYSSGATLSFSNAGVAFSVSAGTNTSFAAVKSALEASPLVVSTTAAGANNLVSNSISGNGTLRQASFLVDSSGSYKTNDTVQLLAIKLTTDSTALDIDASDLSTANGARAALVKIDNAITTVSTALGSIGANQNRISYAQDNLKTKIANFSAAESVIRDVDMADEMTKFSKSNILAQAGTAMLAQANQAAQGVLQLLRG